MNTFAEQAAGMAKMMDPNYANLEETEVALHWGVILNDSPIASITLENDVLLFSFENGRSLQITDEGQSCCEHRYMSTDDELSSLIGAELVQVEVVSADDADDDHEVHEQTFLKIRTRNGDMTVVTHNEHNGYYGGFDIKASWQEPVG